MKSPAHFFRRLNLGLRSGSSDLGTWTSLRASSSNALKPLGFFGFCASMLALLLQPHESCAIDAAQLPPSETTASHATQHGGKSLGIIAAPGVESKLLFVAIAMKMERCDVRPRPFEAAFEQRPEIFEAVGVDQTPDVLLRVVDSFMDVQPVESRIDGVFVGVEIRPAFDVAQDERIEASRIDCIYYVRPHFPTPFQKSVNDSLADSAATANLFLAHVGVHVPRLAADKRFVTLDGAAQLAKGARPHRLPDAVAHKPSGLLCDAERPAKLVGTDCILGIRNTPDSDEPFVESERRIFKDGHSLEAALLAAVAALEDGARGDFGNVFASALRTGRIAIGPLDPAHVRIADVRIGKVGDCFDKALWFHFFLPLRIFNRNIEPADRRTKQIIVFGLSDFHNPFWFGDGQPGFAQGYAKGNDGVGSRRAMWGAGAAIVGKGIPDCVAAEELRKFRAHIGGSVPIPSRVVVVAQIFTSDIFGRLALHSHGNELGCDVCFAAVSKIITGWNGASDYVITVVANFDQRYLLEASSWADFRTGSNPLLHHDRVLRKSLSHLNLLSLAGRLQPVSRLAGFNRPSIDERIISGVNDVSSA
jgi:hypothetical protein